MIPDGILLGSYRRRVDVGSCLVGWKMFRERPQDSKRHVAWHDYAICAYFPSALTASPAKTWMRSPCLLSKCGHRRSNPFSDNESLSNSQILRHVSGFYETPLQFMSSTFKVCFRARLPRNKMGTENGALLVGDGLDVCRLLAQIRILRAR